jgi:hypothetical protein
MARGVEQQKAKSETILIACLIRFKFNQRLFAQSFRSRRQFADSRHFNFQISFVKPEGWPLPIAEDLTLSTKRFPIFLQFFIPSKNKFLRNSPLFSIFFPSPSSRLSKLKIFACSTHRATY